MFALARRANRSPNEHYQAHQALSPTYSPRARTYLNLRYTKMVTVKHSLSATCCMLEHEAFSSLAMVRLHFTLHAKIGTKELHMR